MKIFTDFSISIHFVLLMIFLLSCSTLKANEIFINKYEGQYKCSEYQKEKINFITLEMKKNNPEAFYIYAQFYYFGICLKEDINQSFLFFFKAAELGHIAAYYNVSLMYSLGVGVTKDLNKSMKMYEKLLQIKYKPLEDYLCDSSSPTESLKQDSVLDEFIKQCAESRSN